MAGAGSLISAPNDDTAARNVATDFATGNLLASGELSSGGGIESGNWNSGNRTFTANGAPLNAVRARAQRGVQTTFGIIMGLLKLSPKVDSVAAVGGANHVDCMVPFGFNQSFLTGKNFGDTINISNQANGNWGKLDFGLDADGHPLNASSQPDFSWGMLNGVCNTQADIGDSVTPGTGGSGLSQNDNNAFQARMEANPIVTMAVVDQFLSGNRPVHIVGFIVVELVGQGGHGRSWSGQVRLLRAGTGSGIDGPTNAPYALSRALVK
jgi:hypothetical protein